MMETKQECPLSSLLLSTELWVPACSGAREEMRNSAGKEEGALSDHRHRDQMQTQSEGLYQKHDQD